MPGTPMLRIRLDRVLCALRGHRWKVTPPHYAHEKSTRACSRCGSAQVFDVASIGWRKVQ